MTNEWKQSLTDLEEAKDLSEVELTSRRLATGLLFLRDDVYPLLERTATVLGESGWRPELQPVAADQIGSEGENAAMVTIRGSSDTISFRVLLSPEAKVIVDFQKPYSDSERAEFQFGFYSGKRVRKALGRFLTENDLPEAGIF